MFSCYVIAAWLYTTWQHMTEQNAEKGLPLQYPVNTPFLLFSACLLRRASSEQMNLPMPMTYLAFPSFSSAVTPNIIVGITH